MPPDEVLEPFALGLTAHVLAFVLGALFGSFANVCIYRWPPTDEHPRGQSVVRPGSRCPACGKPVRWSDNVPLLSYLILRGRCRDCGAAFSARYLLVEAAMGILFLAAYHFTMVAGFPYDPLSVRVLRFLVLSALVFVLVVITFIDLDHRLILDKITYPAIPVFYGLGLLLPERDWPDGLIGAAVGYGVVWLIGEVYYRLTGREGLGLGDGKLLALIGALLGWQAVVAALFAGSLIGSVVSIPVLLAGQRRARPTDPAGDTDPSRDQVPAQDGDGDDTSPLRHAQIPFGPFLALGAILYIFVEPWLAVGFVGL
jgi:leader peptidase (prepilin peptidase) / N-methyltransferase